MAEKLFDAKRLDKYAKNGYESCAFSQREEQDAFSFWWPLVKDCGIRVPETVRRIYFVFWNYWYYAERDKNFKIQCCKFRENHRNAVCEGARIIQEKS